MTLALSLFAGVALAGNCPAPNEYSASAFKTIESGGDLASYLERYIVGRTAKNEDCEDMYQVAIRYRNEKARKHLDRIGFGPQSEKDVKDNKYFEYAVRYGDTGVINEIKGKMSDDTVSFYLRYYAGDWAGSGNSIQVIDWFIETQKLNADSFFISAIHSNSRYVIEQLIRRGADIRNERVMQAALRRVYKKPAELPVLELLIRAGASITPGILHFASYDNAPAELEMLHLAGGHFPQTSLDAATSRGNVEAMKYFMGLGLNLEEVPEGALHVVAKSGKIDAVKFVLERTKDINELNSRGFSALNYAEDEDTIKLLVKSGADINLYNTHGQTALQQAVAYKSAEKVKLLLKLGATVNLPTRDDLPLIHLIMEDLASSDDAERVLRKVSLLVKSGANINAKDSEGYTVLMKVAKYTARNNTKELIRLLLSLGANKNISVRVGRKRLRAYDMYGYAYLYKEIHELLK